MSTENKQIANALREWCERYTLRKDAYDELMSIAEHIDAKHEKTLSQAYMDVSDSEWVRLPKDADGVPIHLGDVMDGVNKYDTHQEVTGRVTTISFDATLDPNDSTSVGIRVWSDDNKSYRVIYIDPYASVYRHHHDPTVEDILTEFAEKMNENTAMYISEAWDTDEHDKANAKTIAEYATKLREMLAGDAK